MKAVLAIGQYIEGLYLDGELFTESTTISRMTAEQVLAGIQQYLLRGKNIEDIEFETRILNPIWEEDSEVTHLPNKLSHVEFK